MPERSPIQCAVQRLFHSAPRFQTAALRVLDWWYQLALLPYRRRRRKGSDAEDEHLVSRTEAYNEAAERYFANFETPAFLLNKPFSEPAALPKYLIDAGVLISALRIAPGDVVLEFGAGSCWLSHMLNRYGCTTISVDVSPTAMQMGRQLFQSDPRTNWELHPRFLAYDGHRLPVDDGACQRIVINDAFHHVPNQRQLLTEMYRVLGREGIVAMSEPGRGHARAQHSVDEAREWGVLENELVLEDVAALARACGFDEVKVVPATPHVQAEVDAADLGPFMGGKGFAAYWKGFCSALEQHHYILLYKGRPRPTTRRPAALAARLDVNGIPSAYAAGVPIAVRLQIANAGDTVWLGGTTVRAGWTRVGAHLYRGRTSPALVDYDWWRADLPETMEPGAQVTLDVRLPPVAMAGEYVIVFDLVVEGITWFAAQGSAPLEVMVRITD